MKDQYDGHAGVLYAVEVEADAEIAATFDTWLRDHIADLLALPGFRSAEILEAPAADAARVRRIVHYRLRDQAALDAYLAGNAVDVSALCACPPEPPLIVDATGEPVDADAPLTAWPPQGNWVSMPLDSAIARCTWHRVVLTGVLPPGTQASVSSRTAESEEPPEALALLPDEAWQPAGTWRAPADTGRNEPGLQTDLPGPASGGRPAPQAIGTAAKSPSDSGQDLVRRR